MISATSSPTRTRLTFFARRNGFCCLQLADDLRNYPTIKALIGIAVMSSPFTDGYVRDKCQLVVLDTQIHKTQDFLEVKPIMVAFDGDKFLSCALIS